MQTSEEVKELFLKELQELLDKWGAEFEILDGVLNVDILPIYNSKTSEYGRQYANFDLPYIMSPTKLAYKEE